MRWIISLLLLVGIIATSSASTAPTALKITGPSIENKPIPQFDIRTIRVKEVRKLIGRKLTLKEKIAFKVYQWKLKKERRYRAGEQSGKGKAALILGIAGLVFLFIPIVTILAIPSAILAIVFGNMAKKENPNDRQARTGVLLGWITVGIAILALLIVVALLSNPHFWFG